MKRIFRPILITAIIVLTSSLPAFSCANAKVVKVYDGDTIMVLCGDVFTKVRLFGIDCPEKGQPYGKKAKQLTADLVGGKVVDVVEHTADRYGRVVGEVLLKNSKNLSHELLRAGLAWWHEKYAPDSIALKELEAEALTNKSGLWSDERPIPPWDWRKGIK